ncbi:SRPBCC family protein [Salipiger abyssi]|uniref:Polyketide cyclase / dehydrase and lipid transport n=1 Tax=Salipiger abyssi TaxID=1250539 RepID=A0A1P8UVE0_9RHOB|nr:SRPBCC family protein [Salipiger abyssi]APZ53326.1 Polyketide cyclase / dehydrase and lipid transport [Salipiger abyssi]
MRIEHTVEIEAPATTVFALYADPELWPVWDGETKAVGLPELRTGATGWLQPREGPKAKIRVTDVTPNRSFTIEGTLPLCRMTFGHELTGNGRQTRATHWVQFSGPLAFLFRRLIGAGIDRTLPDTLAGLKRVSEEGVARDR